MRKEDLDRIPSKETIDKFISDFKETDFTNYSTQELYKRIYDDMAYMPAFEATLKKGTTVQRARINWEYPSLFNSQSEISYQHDSELVKKFGRANFPKQPMFYGVVKEGGMTLNSLLTLVYELSEQYQEGGDKIPLDLYLTLSQWEILQDIQLIDMMWSKKAQENSSRLQEAVKYHNEHSKLDIGPKYEDVIRFQEFISDNFASPRSKPNDVYKLGATYSNFLLDNRRSMDGITYPSVRFSYKTQNIAIRPMSAEYKMKLQAVAVYHFKYDGVKDIRCVPVKGAVDFGVSNSKFDWRDSHELENGNYSIRQL